MDRELVTGDAENLEHECIEGTTHASSTAPTTPNTSTDIDMTEQIDINNQVQEQEVQPAALTDNSSVTSPSHSQTLDNAMDLTRRRLPQSMLKMLTTSRR